MEKYHHIPRLWLLPSSICFSLVNSIPSLDSMEKIHHSLPSRGHGSSGIARESSRNTGLLDLPVFAGGVFPRARFDRVDSLSRAYSLSMGGDVDRSLYTRRGDFSRERVIDGFRSWNYSIYLWILINGETTQNNILPRWKIIFFPLHWLCKAL